MNGFLHLIVLATIVIACLANEHELLKELKQLYKKMAIQYHPDKQHYSKEVSNILFAETTNIYESFISIVKKNIEENEEYECKKYHTLEKNKKNKKNKSYKYVKVEGYTKFLSFFMLVFLFILLIR